MASMNTSPFYISITIWKSWTFSLKRVLKDKKERLARAYDTYTALKKELEQAVVDEDQRRRDIAFLEFEIDEIQSAHLQRGRTRSWLPCTGK